MNHPELAPPTAIPRWETTKYGRQSPRPSPGAAVARGAEPDPEDPEDFEDRAVMLLMLGVPMPLPWSLDELEREMGSRVAARDAVRRLRAAGLLHALHSDDPTGYVFPSRAALRAYELLAS